MNLNNHPISNIQWIAVDDLKANDYNPNFVLGQEMNLLKLSLMVSGWIQPILITQDNVIIDGFHRSTLARTDKQVRELTEGLVPCAVLNLTEAERKMLTVRINRAKGVHSALKMHELVHDLHTNHKLTIKEIGQGIGADKAEVDLLLQEGIFKKLDIDNHQYTEAWGVTEENTD